MINKKEILERVLLNMKYDSRKTLSENKEGFDYGNSNTIGGEKDGTGSTLSFDL